MKVIDQDKLRMLADLFDQAIPNDKNPEIQNELREWADYLDNGGTICGQINDQKRDKDQDNKTGQ